MKDDFEAFPLTDSKFNVKLSLGLFTFLVWGARSINLNLHLLKLKNNSYGKFTIVKETNRYLWKVTFFTITLYENTTNLRRGKYICYVFMFAVQLVSASADIFFLVDSCSYLGHEEGWTAGRIG